METNSLLRTAHNLYKSKKLIKILLEYEEDNENNKINSVRITGDFFLYPEERLDDLEMQLKGTSTDKR